MPENEDRRRMDVRIEEHISKEEACMSEMKDVLFQNKDDIEKISESLFGEDGIATWAKQHINAEKDRREIMRELKKKLAVRGGLTAISVLAFLIWLGVKEYFNIGD